MYEVEFQSLRLNSVHMRGKFGFESSSRVSSSGEGKEVFCFMSREMEEWRAR